MIIIHFQALRRARQVNLTEITSKIRQLFTQLDVEPRNSHEKEIVCNAASSSMRIVTENTIASANALLCNLRKQKQTNTQIALETIDKIQTIADKLGINYSSTLVHEELCSYKTIELVS